MQEKKQNKKVAVITGGAHGIGKAAAERFAADGVEVCIIDIAENNDFVGDVSRKEDLIRFSEYVISRYGHVDYLINNALPAMKGIHECEYEEFEYALRVGVTSAFYLTKLFLPYFAERAAIVNISSSRDRMSQPETESYTAAKGGISALTHALAVTLAGKVRVNSISPGWIDTREENYGGADALQQPAGRVGVPEDIAEMVVYLCSERAGFITGENICIDGGMTRQMIYHGEHGWTFDADGVKCDGASGEYVLCEKTADEKAANEHADEFLHMECCSGKNKERTEKEVRDLMNRLKRIEGQVRGIENMLERNVYCTDILTQVSAVTAALNSFNKVLLAEHVRTCVADNIRNGNDEVIDELVTLLQKLMR